MTQIDKKLVETVARAMVTAIGRDPDESVVNPHVDAWLEHCPHWKALEPDARKQIAAFDAIREFHRMTGRRFWSVT